MYLSSWKPDYHGWQVNDDRSNGGISEGSIEMRPPGKEPGDNRYHLNFFGLIDSIHSEGYCAARCDDFKEPIDLSKYAGISMMVRSEKKLRYLFGIHDEKD